METHQCLLGRYLPPVLIVPKWNGNASNSVTSFPLRIGLNRTKVKWKLLIRPLPVSENLCLNRTKVKWKPSHGVVMGWVSRIVLIVPKWNGNLVCVVFILYCIQVLIVPKWNGNEAPQQGGQDGKDVLIVPKWNGNLACFNDTPCLYTGLNRTKVKWKPLEE